MKIQISLIVAVLLYAFPSFGQDEERYQFVQGEFRRGHITVHDQSTLEEGRIAEDYIILRNKLTVTTGAAKFLFMSESGQEEFMIEFHVNEAHFSFKYDKGSIYNLTDGQNELVYDQGFSNGDVTYVTFDNNNVAILYNGVVLDQALQFGTEVSIETKFTPLSNAPFTGEFVLTEEHIQPMTSANLKKVFTSMYRYR